MTFTPSTLVGHDGLWLKHPGRAESYPTDDAT